MMREFYGEGRHVNGTDAMFTCRCVTGWRDESRDNALLRK